MPSSVAQVPKNFRALLIGASEAGKLSWIASLIKNKATVFPKPGYAKFIYCSPNLGESTLSSARDLEYQRSLTEWAQPAGIVFLNHVITEEELAEEMAVTDGRILLVIDHFSAEVFSTNLVYQLFTRLSSHADVLTCISLHQGVTSKSPGKWHGLVFNNSNFFVIFRNLGNEASIGEISKKMFPYGKNFLYRCLQEATNICGNYAYVFVDANLNNPLNNKFGVRTNLFEENGLPMLMMKSPTVYHGTH